MYLGMYTCIIHCISIAECFDPSYKATHLSLLEGWPIVRGVHYLSYQVVAILHVFLLQDEWPLARMATYIIGRQLYK